MNPQSRDIRLVNPQSLEAPLREGLAILDRDRVVRRVWARDWTVWKAEDREISEWLGWLRAPETATEAIPEVEAFAASVRGLGLTHAAVLGMGGSSLAPDVLARLFPTGPGALELEIVDTTEPADVAAAAARLPADKTLFIVSSKSGKTAEMLSLFSFFYDRAVRELGEDHAGGRFIAVTDPGTPLEALARERRFRRVFHGRPDIGGRFSALSAFGLVPAALKGLDLHRLLAPARDMAAACRDEQADGNPGARLGTILGAAGRSGRNKVTFLTPARLRPLGGWLEQLLAESTGKEGRGLLPVVEDRPGPAATYGHDRLFVAIGPAEPSTAKEAVPGPEGTTSPLVRIPFEETYDLAGHFFLWEFATAVAGRFLDINPFNQPNVEAAKKRTREILSGPSERESKGAADKPAFVEGLRTGEADPAGDARNAFESFLGQHKDEDFLAILAFLPRIPAVEEMLSGFAAGLRLKTRLPVTVGFGPRYLHSTGQLHKGGPNQGLFLMLAASGTPHLAIPEVAGVKRPAEDFAALFEAQAKGDALALKEKGRRVLTLELSSPVEKGLAALSSFLA